MSKLKSVYVNEAKNHSRNFHGLKWENKETLGQLCDKLHRKDSVGHKPYCFMKEEDTEISHTALYTYHVLLLCY